MAPQRVNDHLLLLGAPQQAIPARSIETGQRELVTVRDVRVAIATMCLTLMVVAVLAFIVQVK